MALPATNLTPGAGGKIQHTSPKRSIWWYWVVMKKYFLVADGCGIINRVISSYIKIVGFWLLQFCMHSLDCRLYPFPNWWGTSWRCSGKRSWNDRVSRRPRFKVTISKVHRGVGRFLVAKNSDVRPNQNKSTQTSEIWLRASFWPCTQTCDDQEHYKRSKYILAQTCSNHQWDLTINIHTWYMNIIYRYIYIYMRVFFCYFWRCCCPSRRAHLPAAAVSGVVASTSACKWQIWSPAFMATIYDIYVPIPIPVVMKLLSSSIILNI